MTQGRIGWLMTHRTQTSQRSRGGCGRSRQRGLSVVELTIFMTISSMLLIAVGTALPGIVVGVLGVLKFIGKL